MSGQNGAGGKKILTLCIVHQRNKVLLGMKKRGFGAGRWNGFGGKINEGETIEMAALRELREEAGIDASHMEKAGVMEFEFKGNPEILETHLFRLDEFTGDPKESEEMRPEWFDVSDIPFENMWPDDIYWFPLFLGRKKFTGRFLFGEGDVILNMELREVATVE